MQKKILMIIVAAILIFAMAFPGVGISANSVQTPLDPTTIDQFVQPLAKLDVAGGTIQTILAGNNQIGIDIKEFKANMLPPSFMPTGGDTDYTGTWVWGYLKAGTNTSVTRDTYTGPVVVATRDVPTEIKFTNDLGTTATTHSLAYLNAIDQSLHWANPNNIDRYVPAGEGEPVDWVGNPDHYEGSIPAAVHLHGGEVPAALDGGPEAWFTSSGQHGKAFYSKDNNTNGNYAIYRYPNVQEAASLWFHDHTLGATRLNVYMGIAGGYLLTDPKLKLPAGLSATGLRGGALGPNPEDDTVIPLVIQDRMFDTNGQLYFPATGINPEHQYWIPEFFGDTIAVNGKVWPYNEVKAQRYEFITINGSNARSYALTFQGGNNSAHPDIWQIGTDQGYLDQPVKVDPLIIMPGERAQFIIDFSGLTPGTELILNNIGPDEPFNGVLGTQDPADPDTTGKVMQFKVVSGASNIDSSFNPAASGATIREGGNAIVRLVDPATGKLAKNVQPELTRELTLNEIVREEAITVGGVTYEGGPLEILVNNTKWMGVRPDMMDPNSMMGDPVNGGVPDGIGNWLTETPKEGTTEVWEIVNMTMDAHPIHTHLAQFQLLNRQEFDMDAYMAEAYDPAFPGGMFMPAYGPPLSYTPSIESGGKYGGNPDVTPYLKENSIPPNPNEAGWKDTVLAPPGMITRFVIRWGPTDMPATANPDAVVYPFLPNDTIPGKEAIFDYVWHCHIVDHEDNEMMRPDAIIPQENANHRSYVIGEDY